MSTSPSTHLHTATTRHPTTNEGAGLRHGDSTMVGDKVTMLALEGLKQALR